MAALQSFRSAFNGFNREDVVHYIEYLNNTHNAQLNQFRTQIQTLEAELAALHAQPAQDAGLASRLETALGRCDQLEAELAEARAQAVQPADCREDELEAYRRAERAERRAQARAEQLHAQASGVLADATASVEEAAARIDDMANQVAAQLGVLQETVSGSKRVLHDAAASLYAICPGEE